MDPSGPAQPTLNQAYTTSGNPADQDPQEQHTASVNESTNAGSLVERREKGDIPVPSSHGEEPQGSALGYGVRDDKGDKEGPVCLPSRTRACNSFFGPFVT